MHNVGFVPEKYNLAALAADLGLDESNVFNFPENKLKSVLQGDKYLLEAGSPEKSEKLTDSAPENITAAENTSKKRKYPKKGNIRGAIEEYENKAAENTQKKGYSKNGVKLGRPRGSTLNNKGEKTFYQKRLEALREKNAADFPVDVVEHVKGELITDDIEYLKECYKTTIENTYQDFITEYSELIKTPQKNWVTKLYVTIKQNIPKITPSLNPGVLSFVYDVYTTMCFNLGIIPSINGFCIMSGFEWWNFKDWVQKQNRLTPEHVEFIKKALGTTENNMVNSLLTTGGSNTNIMFLLNSCYGYDKKTTVEHVAASDRGRSLSDIPVFLEEK